jgi:hypothetical protein
MHKILRAIAANPQLLEVGRQAVEAALLQYRDMRLSEFNRNNGLVCKEKDGADSHIIRFGPEEGIRLGLQAIAAHLEAHPELAPPALVPHTGIRKRLEHERWLMQRKYDKNITDGFPEAAESIKPMLDELDAMLETLPPHPPGYEVPAWMTKEQSDG